MKKIIIFILLILLIFPFVKSFVKHLHSFLHYQWLLELANKKRQSAFCTDPKKLDNEFTQRI